MLKLIKKLFSRKRTPVPPNHARPYYKIIEIDAGVPETLPFGYYNFEEAKRAATEFSFARASDRRYDVVNVPLARKEFSIKSGFVIMERDDDC